MSLEIPKVVPVCRK